MQHLYTLMLHKYQNIPNYTEPFMSTQPQKVTVSFNSIKETPIKPTRVGKRPAIQIFHPLP